MSEIKITSKAKNIIAVTILILIVVVPIGFSIASHVSAQMAQDVRPFLEMPDPKHGKDCVEDTEYMRYHHWELLRAIREDIVRYGKRNGTNLNKCQECHTSRDRFCNQCHNAVSLTPDCFGCHYYP